MGILVRGGEGYLIDHVNNSGLIFSGAGGPTYSIAVNAYNSRTYIGNSTGTQYSAEIDNTKWINQTGVCYGVSGTEYLLTQLPNDKATINISFYNDTAVDIQNFQIRAYDGSNIANAPSGIEVKLAEIIHPATDYSFGGSGDTYWTNASGSTGILNLSDSPGSSALIAWSGGTQASTFSDWYVAVSVKPTSVGSKTGNKLYMSLEYL